MIGEYLTLDPRRLAQWDEWTQRQRDGQVVRVFRDTDRERAAVHAAREHRAGLLPRLALVSRND